MFEKTRVVSATLEEQLRILQKLFDARPGFRAISVSTYSSSSSDDSDKTVEIPELLESRETLELLEFDPSAADVILENWHHHLAHHVEGMPDPSFLGCIKAYIRRGNDAFDEDDDWYAAMTSMGVTRAQQERIMHPDFATIRLGQSAMGWVIETVQDRYHWLESLDSNITSAARRPGQGSTASGPSSTSAARVVTPSGPPSAAIRPPPLGVFQIPANQPQSAAAASEPTLKPGQRFLYKGGSKVRLREALPAFADGNPMLDSLRTFGNADFSIDVGWYFTKQRDTAELYARYALERGGRAEEAAILTIAIDNELLEAQVPVEGDLWRQYVWSKRLHNKVAPPDAVTYLDDAPLLVGPILCMANEAVTKLWRAGESCDCLRPAKFQNSNTTRSQHAVKDRATIQEWNRHATVWLESKGKA